MNYFTKRLLLGATLLSIAMSNPARAGQDCNGHFVNFITDICWSCMFPMTFGASNLALPVSMGQEGDTNPGGSPICLCGANLGVKVSFWEPVRHVDVVRKPFCLSAMGMDISGSVGLDAPRGTHGDRDDSSRTSLYQAHWYIDSVLTLIGAVLDSNCLEQKPFDVGYMTEFDPLWNDDEMTSILNPDSFLFGNLIAQLACGADCVASTIGFGSNTLFWCAGCQGSMYPMNGHVAAHIGGVQASSLIAERFIAKMHREGLMWAAQGDAGLCGYYPQFLMDKTGYKYQMHFPVPQDKIFGKCCQPLGRTTILWGANKEIPNTPVSEGGEDFAYLIFRKRTCCQGAF